MHVTEGKDGTVILDSVELTEKEYSRLIELSDSTGASENMVLALGLQSLYHSNLLIGALKQPMTLEDEDNSTKESEILSSPNVHKIFHEEDGSLSIIVETVTPNIIKEIFTRYNWDNVEVNDYNLMLEPTNLKGAFDLNLVNDEKGMVICLGSYETLTKAEEDMQKGSLPNDITYIITGGAEEVIKKVSEELFDEADKDVEPIEETTPKEETVSEKVFDNLENLDMTSIVLDEEEEVEPIQEDEEQATAQEELTSSEVNLADLFNKK